MIRKKCYVCLCISKFCCCCCYYHHRCDQMLEAQPIGNQGLLQISFPLVSNVLKHSRFLRIKHTLMMETVQLYNERKKKMYNAKPHTHIHTRTRTPTPTHTHTHTHTHTCSNPGEIHTPGDLAVIVGKILFFNYQRSVYILVFNPVFSMFHPLQNKHYKLGRKCKSETVREREGNKQTYTHKER